MATVTAELGARSRQLDHRQWRRRIRRRSPLQLQIHISSYLKGLLTDHSKTMSYLKTQAYILNRKGDGVNKIVSFANCTNSALQRPTQR